VWLPRAGIGGKSRHMNDRDKLPAKTTTGAVVPAERPDSLVARGLEAITKNRKVAKSDVEKDPADPRNEPYLFAVNLWFTVATAKALKHLAEKHHGCSDLANRAEALEHGAPEWMTKPRTPDEQRMRWEMFDFAQRIMARHGDGLAETIHRELNKVAEQLSAEAQFDLGEAHHEGDGVSQSDAWAMYWWRKAAEQGCGAAQYQLGRAYANGEGVPKDYVKAHMWFSINWNWDLDLVIPARSLNHFGVKALLAITDNPPPRPSSPFLAWTGTFVRCRGGMPVPFVPEGRRTPQEARSFQSPSWSSALVSVDDKGHRHQTVTRGLVTNARYRAVQLDEVSMGVPQLR
jgi:Sel1 repeat